MSSSAALAAAKKRRNPGSMDQYGSQQRNPGMISQQQQPQEIQVPRAPTNINQLVVQHDARLFVLEKQLANGKDDFATKRDLEMLQLTNSAQNLGIINANNNAGVDNAILNKVEKQVKDIVTLNTTVAMLNKSVADANTLITTLRASALSHAKEVQELKETVQSQAREVAELHELKQQLNGFASLKAQLMEYNQVKIDFYNFLDKGVSPLTTGN